MTSTMDRPIPAAARHYRTLRRAVAPLAIAGAVVASLFFVRAWARPSVARDQLYTGRVDAGPVESVLSSTGVVIPAAEEILTAPLAGTVRRWHARPGETLAAGQAIVDIDVTDAEVAAHKLDEQLRIKEQEKARLGLELEDALIELRAEGKRLRLDIQNLNARSDRDLRLRQEGLVSDEMVAASRLEVAKAEVALEEAGLKAANTRRRVEAQIGAAAMEREMLAQERQALGRRIEAAHVRAPRAGVLTLGRLEVGTNVRAGDEIGRVADLDRVRIEATFSDIHAQRVATGLPARVVAHGRTLDALVAEVLPTVKDGALTVLLDLAGVAGVPLPPQLRVDVHVVVDRRAAVVRAPRGDELPGPGRHQVFVIRGDRAVRTPVTIGLAGVERCEVESGLVQGDEVVLSGLRDYAHLAEVRLKD